VPGWSIAGDFDEPGNISTGNRLLLVDPYGSTTAQEMLAMLRSQSKVLPYRRALLDGNVAMREAACRADGYTMPTPDARLPGFANERRIPTFLKSNKPQGTHSGTNTILTTRLLINFQ
jgi:hypothetical protein